MFTEDLMSKYSYILRYSGLRLQSMNLEEEVRNN